MGERLSLRSMSDVELLFQKQLLDDDETFLDHRNDRRIALRPDVRSIFDQPIDRHTCDIDDSPVEFDAGALLPDLRPGLDF